MKYLNIAICEDKLEDQKNLLDIIENNKLPKTITVFSSGEELLRGYGLGKFDLIFMDIYMGTMSGIETVAEIRKLDEDVSIAFTTTSTEHALESYRLEALKYIEKPVNEKKVVQLLQLASIKKENEAQLTIHIKGQTKSIFFKRILYLEQKSHKLYVYLTGDEIVKANEKIDNIEKQFEGQNFFRCHKSYLVNFAYVKNLNRDLKIFTMKEGQNVYIRRKSLAQARKAFEAYLFKMAREMRNE